MQRNYLTGYEYKQLIGQHFNELEVIGTSRNSHGRTLLCRCSCGKIKEARLYDLQHGIVKSCGHIRQQGRIRHGMTGTRLWTIWDGMKKRCNQESQQSYKYYGAKGVTICAEWYDFETFEDWATSHGYRDDLTLDRIESWKGYGPNNCRWVTREFQNRRKSDVIKVVDRFEVLTLQQLADRYGLTYRTVYTRYKAGKRGADLIKQPGQRSKQKPAELDPEYDLAIAQ